MQDHVPRLTAKNIDFTVLELGPGDSLATAVISKSLGASQTWLVDAGSFAATGMRVYTALFDYLQQQRMWVPSTTALREVADILKTCHCVYLTDGVRSLAQLPSDSVDYCFSNAVLEHVPKSDFPLLVTELIRVLKPDGISVHRVDLKDHLGGKLNNLRFSEATWESSLFRSSGFYTNRIRFDEMLAIFQQAGFDYQLPRVLHWEKLPTPRDRLDQSFRYLPEDDLLVSGFDVVLKRKG
jgi:SAM-dependent methyltransferase